MKNTSLIPLRSFISFRISGEGDFLPRSFVSFRISGELLLPTEFLLFRSARSWILIGAKNSGSAIHRALPAAPPIKSWQYNGTRLNISEFHSEISTRVPFCIERGAHHLVIGASQLAITGQLSVAARAALNGGAPRGSCFQTKNPVPVTFYPQHHAGRGEGIRNGAVAAVRLPKILVLVPRGMLSPAIKS